MENTTVQEELAQLALIAQLRKDLRRVFFHAYMKNIITRADYKHLCSVVNMLPEPHLRRLTAKALADVDAIIMGSSNGL